MSVRPNNVPATAEEQADGTWVLLDLVDSENAISREAWSADGTRLFLEFLDSDSRARRRITLYFEEGMAELDFEEAVGVVTRTDETCTSLGPALPDFPDSPLVVRLTFQIVNPEPAYLRYEVGDVGYQNASEDWVDETGALATAPEWADDDDFGDTQETDVEPFEAVIEARASTGLFEETEETDAEFDGDAGDTDSITDQVPELDVEALDEPPLLDEVEVEPLDEPPLLAEVEVEPLDEPPLLAEVEVEPLDAPPSLDDLERGSESELPELEVEAVAPTDDSGDDFMLPPDESEAEEVFADEPELDATPAAPERATPPPGAEYTVPLAQVVGSDRDGRFISTHADDSLNIEAIYDEGTLTSFTKTDVKKKPEFKRTLADGRDMLVIYGPEGTLSYIRTKDSRRVQVQHDGLVKWDQSGKFDANMTAEEFNEAFCVYDKLHRHFAYDRVRTPWRLSAFGFEPYSSMVDVFDQFFDATIFAENRDGDWLVMIDEPGPHQGKIFVNYHQDGLYHLDVLDEFIMDYVDPEIVDDRNALIEDMPFFSDHPILGGYARYYAELNLRPVDDLLSGLRHVPELDLADLM